MTIDLDSLVPVLAALVGGGGIAGIAGAFFAKRKVSAEGRSIEIKGELQLVDASISLVVELKKEMSEIRKRLSHLEDENFALKKEMAHLRIENMSLKKRCAHLEEENAKLKRERSE